jgi:hypothetical protein
MKEMPSCAGFRVSSKAAAYLQFEGDFYLLAVSFRDGI